jgi:niacin transporter
MFKTKKMIVTALHIALGIVLPIALHSVPNAGNIFLPMHIPVLMCGIACGFPYGLICGVLAPLLSSFLSGMPSPAYLPSMLCELAVYGAVSSLLTRFVSVKNQYAKVYISLAGAMLSGRIVYGVLNALIFSAGSYSLRAWMTSSFVTALPGIVIQLILIPAVIFALRKVNLAEA